MKNHKAGNKGDEYGKLAQEILSMCNTEQCTKGTGASVPDAIQRSLADKPLLQIRLESLLQERDELFGIAMRRLLGAGSRITGCKYVSRRDP